MQVTSLRFSMITGPGDYRHLAIAKPETFKPILWSYIDIRDAVTACIAALQAELNGAIHLNITGDDTLSDRTTEELLKSFYSEVGDLRKTFQDREAIVSNTLAKKLLSWQPKYSWSNTEVE
ncbi:hypothetical protein D3C71_1740560 [compost metagenome]